MDEGEISKTDSLNTPAFQNPEVDTTEILSTECVASEGKSVRQNTCSVCGAFGHNKKFHKKKCKICHTSGHVSFRCPNKSTAKEAGTSSLKSIDELHFPERERRGTKQDLTQGEMDITARVLLCCHNEKKWKENYTLLTSTSNMQPGSSVLSNLLGTQHCPPTICDQTQSHFQGMVTQTVSSMQPNQQQQVQQHQHQQHQQQQHQQHQVHQQQVPQQQLNQQHQVDTFYIQVPV
ncbi:G-box-binding factor-like isoform X2 [Anneissia japonica]|uniref:G-box-binding factor-like isoform X2 n=1 Tax=Anneissia japonica TaxID=1529436 RepID=UPI00142575E5|nr:G-box-binding factor-like isoform X2 [Anneissia japonica]